MPPFLRTVTRLFRRKTRPASARPRLAATSARPSLEALEDRTLLDTVRWMNPAGGGWSVAANWDAGRVPGAADDVVIDLASITVTHASGTDAVNSLTVSNGTFNFSGGTLSVATTLQGNSTFNFSGGTLAGATVAAGTTIRGTSAGSATLSGVTLNGVLDVSGVSTATVSVRDGLTLNGTALVGNAAGTIAGRIFFTNTQTIGGTGSVVLGGNSGNRLLATGTGAVATFGAGLTVRGSTGTLDTPGSGARFINQGTITADVAGGTLALDGLLSNGGTLGLANGGRLHLAGVTITGGTLTGSGAGVLLSTSTSELAAVTLAGDLTLTSLTGTVLNVRDGLTVAGTLRLGDAAGATWGRLYFINPQTVTGPGSIVFGGNSTNLLIATGAAVTVTLGPTLTVRGDSGTLDAPVSGVRFLNQGTIIADVAGGTLILDGAFTNGGTLGLANGGSLRLGGAAVTGGTMTGSGPGALISSSTSELTAVTLAGDLTLTSLTGSVLNVRDGLTVAGTLRLGDAAGAGFGRLTFTNTQAVSGTGSIVFGNNINNALRANGAGVAVVFDAGLAIRGDTGRVDTLGSGALFVNLGTITADGAGGTITLDGPFLNFGSLGLANGGNLRLEGAAILGGTLTGSGSGNLVIASTNELAAVTLAGDVTLTSLTSAIANVRDGLTVAGTLRVGDAAGATSGRLAFIGTQSATGPGSIVLGGNVLNRLIASGAGAALTLGPTLTIRGGAGTVLTSGTGANFINQGTITADGGGTITLTGPWTNEGTGRAENAGTLLSTTTPTNFSGGVLTGGSWQAFANSTLQVNLSPGITTNAAAIVLNGAGSNFNRAAGLSALTGLTVNAPSGSYTVRSGRSFTTGGNFTNNGTLAVGAGSTFRVIGSLTNFSGNTLTGGTYEIGGTFKFTGADIHTNAAILILDGPAAAVVNEADADALAALTTNTAAGSLTVRNGRDLTTGSGFGNAGAVTVGTGSTLTVVGGTSDGTFTIAAGATLALSGHTIAVTAAVTGAGAVRFEGSNSFIVGTYGVGDTNVTSGGSVVFATAAASGTFTNAGTVVITLASGVSSAVVQTSNYTQTSGITVLSGGGIVASLVDLQGGVLQTYEVGYVVGNLTNAGVIVVARLLDVLFVQGVYTQTETGILLALPIYLDDRWFFFGLGI